MFAMSLYTMYDGCLLDSGDVRLYIDRYFDIKSRIIGNCFTCVHCYKKAHNLHQ